MVVALTMAACVTEQAGEQPDAGVDAWTADLSICTEMERATTAAPDIAEVVIEGRIVTPGTYTFEDKVTRTTWVRRMGDRVGSYGVSEGATVLRCVWRDAL